VLEALVETSPACPLLPKLVRGLLAHRVKGRWANTQECLWVPLALDSYFQAFEKSVQAFEKSVPDFVARVWTKDEYAGQHVFRGRSPDSQQVDVPVSQAGDVMIEKRGTGRLYYRVGLSYIPRSLALPPARHGFSVSRTYEGGRQEADGTWHIRAGDEVRVRVRMATEGRRFHVALTDPLPGGLEPVQVRLRGSSSGPETRSWWWNHENLRDERAEAFATVLGPGV